MVAVIALFLAAVGAFILMGILLGIWRVGDALSGLLNEVAHLIPFLDDEQEEEYLRLLDDVGYDIDEESDDLFTEIAKGLDDIDELGNQIAEADEGQE